ncbi:nitrogen fixation protein NifZ [Methyloraptor flagellatus]|uniref:Nitrogen fixation protein NifZ n=1 Tax=Methyloraptor flagellatus TaxID=3162530 RepID=A0AAU7XG43_9HYPH
MGLGTEQEIETRRPPVFMPGEKVRSTKYVKNDGTYRGKDIGEILVVKGDVGYVRDIGTFLQQFYIYAVEWVDRGTIVGMRAKELVSLDKPPVETKKPAAVAAGASEGAAR